VPDVLHLIGESLTLFATWLSRISSPIPWPLAVGLFFLPFAAGIRTTLWFYRGTVWVVPCKYYRTTQRRRDRACRMPVLGEWHYCRHHHRARRLTDGHVVDPTLKRWQAKTRGGAVERQDIRGVGFVSLLSNRDTLLFHRGIAKRPRDVLVDAPRFRARFRSGWTAFRQLSWQSLLVIPPDPVAGVAARMPTVVRATRFALLAFGVGLFLVGLSVTADGGAQHAVQYSATASFVLAWDAMRFGIWKDPADEPRWLRAAVVDTVKALLVMFALALAGLLLSHLDHAMHRATQTPVPTPAPSATPSASPGT
jgi:hypothetical protein